MIEEYTVENSMFIIYVEFYFVDTEILVTFIFN